MSPRWLATNVIGKNNVKLTGGPLVLSTRCRGHGKLSIEDLVTVAVIGQETVVIIREDDLTLRNTLSKSRHNGTSFSTSH